MKKYINTIRTIFSLMNDLECIYYTIIILLIYKTNFLVDYQLNNINLHTHNLKDIISNVKKKYNIFNKEIIIEGKYLLEINKCLNDNVIFDYNILINEIFKYYLHNENLLDIKEYIKYYNNKLLSDWIYNLINNDNRKTLFDGNVKINSYLDLFKYETKFGLQPNDYIYDIILIQNLINNKYKINDIINTDILVNSIQTKNESFDIIFFDLPNDKHNIIYTQCCERIKKYKIRGTNAICLLLQLITSYLNINGEAIIIIPESFLYNNSKQSIDTRNHIYNNFNIEKIIHINSDIYYHDIDRDLKSITNTMKNCILKIKNNGKTNNIIISTIILNNDKIVENHISDINKLNDSTSFYYKDYISKNTDTNITYIKVDDIFNIYYKNYDKLNINDDCLIINNNSYDKFNTKIGKIDKLDNKIIISNKKEQTNFYYKYYLENIINNNPEIFIKRNSNQFDLSKIQEYEIPVLSINQQITICNYITASKNIINTNNNNINMYTQMNNSILENIPITNMIALNEIIFIIDQPIDWTVISIQRNSLSAGEVNLYKSMLCEKLNSNNYYLISKDNNFILEYIYYYLKFQEPHIKELSKLTQQYNLIKYNLLNIKIPNIKIILQNEIINNCNEFNNNINVLIQNNKMIKDKNIFDIINKINSY